MMDLLHNLKRLIQSPDLASRKWISQQYDSQVMNDTIAINGDASIVRVHGTNKALAICTDCTPRYVEADPFEGAKQAVAETYRNISATGATPLAITNCLNFGNPQKPEIMGQIVRAIKGITQASKFLNYPVVSGNVSLYNETDSRAIQPTPAIGGVGLLKDLNKRCDPKFKVTGDDIFVIGKTSGHINCSLYEREILKFESKENPPIVDLEQEKNNAQFVRQLISDYKIEACHDVSDGGIIAALFEMCTLELGCEIDISNVKIDIENFLFAEDQSRYIIAADSAFSEDLIKKAQKQNIEILKIGKICKGKFKITSPKIDTQEIATQEIATQEIDVAELIKLNEAVFEKKFT